MVEFSKVNVKDIKDEDDDEEEEEPGEEIESAPPLKVGEEREIKSPFGCLKKKLLKRGLNWESPQFGDEVTIHYVGSLLDGTKFVSGDKDKPFTFRLGHGQVITGLDHGIITMRKGEKALFTLPPEVGYGEAGTDGVPPDSIIQFEVELTSWITVVDVCRDGGIIKKIMEKGEQVGPPSDLDEVCVNYKVTLVDDTVVAKTPKEGVEFYIKDGHFCPALPKAIKTMLRGEKVNLIVQPQYAFGDVGKESVEEFPPVPPNSVLNIAMELSAIKPVIDVTGDMKVKKKILKEGEGVLTANEGASVTRKSTLGNE